MTDTTPRRERGANKRQRQVTNDREKQHTDDSLVTDKLYASHRTYWCAMVQRCVPCLYKIGNFDVARDEHFCRQIPNQRPEQCPRTHKPASLLEAPNVTNSDSTSIPYGYQNYPSVLTVGDGDFSFSLALARLIQPLSTTTTTTTTTKKQLGTQGSDDLLSKHPRLVATSYETRHRLEQVYPNMKDTICQLKHLGAIVLFQVDATDLQSTLVEPHHTLLSATGDPCLFDRIVWNFPCTAVASGQDGQNDEMERNKELVRTFVDSARSLLNPRGGQLHMNHKTKPPFNQWQIEKVALELVNDSKGQGSEKHPMVYCGRLVLDRSLFPPYVPRKALDRKSFPISDARTYIFAFQNGTFSENQEHCDLKDAVRDFDDRFNSPQHPPPAFSLLQVTEQVIQGLRRSFLEFPRATKSTKKRGKGSYKGQNKRLKKFG